MRNNNHVKTKLIDLVLGGNRIISGELSGLDRTSMVYWCHRAGIKRIAHRTYEVTDAALTWAKGEVAAGEERAKRSAEMAEQRKIKRRAYAMAYYHANRELCLERTRRWRSQHPDHERGRHAAYRERKIQEHGIEWWKDYIRRLGRASYLRRKIARITGKPAA
jgi:hypothetical protein